MNRTLVICKPDAVERGLIGEIVGRFERKGLRLAAADVRVIDAGLAEKHYAEHLNKPFYPSLVAYIGRSPSVIMVIEGPSGTWQIVRDMIGATDPLKAAPGTIRGDFGLSVTENLVHGSDSEEAAEREVALFFPALSAS